MLNGRFRGNDLGSGTDVFRFDEEFRAGRMSKSDYAEAEAAMSRSAGSCMTMGTASTMASIAEAMGIALPMNGSIPAVDARRRALAEQSGHHAVALVRSGTTISKFLPAPHSRTPSSSTAPLAALPMPWCICWRWPAGSASISASTTGIVWVPASPVWST